MNEMFDRRFLESLVDPTKKERWDRRYLQMAKLVSTWSKDPSTQVGAVLVNYEYQKEFVGYNGFPIGVRDTPERYND
jgi:dCMP deaminase